MPYDETLALRLEEIFGGIKGVEQKKMFGGLAFMVGGHMCVGIVGDHLMARVGPDNYQACLKKDFAEEMTFTGRPMKGMVYVLAERIRTRKDLQRWVDRCLAFVAALPPKEK